MSMVVQHNLQAMNSNRMLGVTTSAQAKSTEKLSSGYRINRAADDAAGLTISEKMRKQIRGLDRASTNAQDGVSAVQTAEGALTEVHSLLQRMNELATQAANGTNSEADREAIRQEIDQLTTEIDRVAETTKFNEMYLLKGDAGTKKINLDAHDAGLKGELTTEGNVGKFQAKELKDGDTVEIGGKTYTIGETTDGLTAASAVEKALAAAMKEGKKDDTITVDGVKYTADNKAGTVAEADLEKILEMAVNSKNAANGDSIKIEDSEGNQITYTYSKVQTEANVLEHLKDAEAATAAAGDSITIGDKKYEYVDATKVKDAATANSTGGFLAATYLKAGATVTLEGVTYTCVGAPTTANTTGADYWFKDENDNFIEAKDIEFKEGDSYSSDGTAANTVRVSDKIAANGLYDAEGNQFKAPDSIEEGTQVAISIAAVTDATKTGTFTVGAEESEGFYDASGKLLTNADVADLVTAGSKVTVTSTTMNAELTGKVNDSLAGTGTIAVTSGTALEANSLTWKDAEGNELTKDMISGLKDGTEVSISATGDKYVVGTPGDAISKETAYEKMAEELKAANSIGTEDEITVTNNGDGTFEFGLGTVEIANTLSFNLHVGADADMTNKIGVKIDTMNAAFLGIKGIDVVGEGNDGGIAATYAIDAIADAISKVSAQRSALGAVQNRLEHTIDNLDNVVENTTAAESRIRDTDMAEEMVEYSKNNILAQAGQSMLAQANQSTQGILSLLG